MTLAIVLMGAVLYLGLAMVVGRFCGLNSAWERAAVEAMRREAEAGGSGPEMPGLEESEMDRVRTAAEPQQKDRTPELVH